ncbi:isopentenyl-diphosphate delta-isomerase [candidate division TM6 bacterium Zodletone_IIa]|nr:isopentenyl-diphosphate delta-isomerase [candidate division TM6 bacterium Zodletone_IIa]
MLEEVILVDEFDTPVGVMEKMEAHRKALLHRAFSVFIFSRKGDMLLQRRALSKYHSGGLWTNACCSHPRPDEDTCEAAKRHLSEELGFAVPLKKIFDFTYRSEFDNGLTEYEFDHVYAGWYDQGIYPNPEEVSEYRWLSLEAIQAELAEFPSTYTSWFHLAFPLIKSWIERSRV